MTVATEAPQPPPYQHLDPGVRDLVRKLADFGFTPTDSGDGVSKPDTGRVFDFLHVVMVVEPRRLVDEAQRLHAVLPGMGRESMVVEATYNPRDGVGVLFLFQPPNTETPEQGGENER